jgi:APA family basic amino acid/polyamine antiporter
VKESSAVDTPPAGLLRPRSAIFLVVANMIGAGVFTSSGFALADHPPHVVVFAWAVGGVLATMGAVCYGALGRRFPHSGGEYELLRRTIHPLAGFLAGVVSLVAGFSAPIAIAATTFEVYLARAFDLGLPAHGLASVLIVGAALLHLRGLELGARAQDRLVVVKLLALSAFIVLGALAIFWRESSLPAVGPSGATLPTAFDLPAFATTCVWVSFAYSGWNAASYLAGEIEAPARNLTRVLLIGTWATMLVYVTLNAVFVYGAPRAELAGQPEVGLVVAKALGGRGGELAMALVVALAAVTSVTAMTMAGPRVYARMAEDGYLPQRIARSARHRAAILLQVVLALAMLWVAPLEDLMQWTGWTLWASSAATVVGLWIVRAREGAHAVPVPGWPFVPLLYLAVSIGIGIFAFHRQWLGGSIVVGALVLVAACYPLIGRRGDRVMRGS